MLPSPESVLHIAAQLSTGGQDALTQKSPEFQLKQRQQTEQFLFVMGRMQEQDVVFTHSQLLSLLEALEACAKRTCRSLVQHAVKAKCTGAVGMRKGQLSENEAKSALDHGVRQLDRIVVVAQQLVAGRAGEDALSQLMNSIRVCSTKGAEKQREANLTLANCGAAASLVQRVSGAKGQQEQQEQQAREPSPSCSVPKQAAKASRARCSKARDVASRVEAFCTAHDKAAAAVGSEAWLKLLQHQLVAEHYTDRLCAVFKCARAGTCPPIVWCKQCKQRLPSSHYLMLHDCSVGKELQPQQHESLADTAGFKDPCPGGCCFLCGSKAAAKAAHVCTSALWRLLAVDQSQLPHANPAESPQVLFQTELLQIRQHCNIVVQTVFMCPEPYLPGSMADEDSASMLRDGTWPLLRFLLVMRPSSFVVGQRGCFPLLPMSHDKGELCYVDKKYRLAAGLQEQLQAQHNQRKADSSTKYTGTFEPSLTRSMAGFYTGALHGSPPDDSENDNLALTGLEWGGKSSWYVDPRQVGSPHVLFNQAHNWAAVLHQPLHLTFPRADGTRTHPLLLLQAEQDGRPQHTEELTWDYQATTTNPADPLHKVMCLCKHCAALKKPHRLVILKKAKRQRAQSTRKSSRVKRVKTV